MNTKYQILQDDLLSSVNYETSLFKEVVKTSNLTNTLEILKRSDSLRVLRTVYGLRGEIKLSDILKSYKARKKNDSENQISRHKEVYLENVVFVCRYLLMEGRDLTTLNV